MKYKNAHDVLPRQLVENIQKFYSGGLLWIPAVNNDIAERNELVVELVKRGERQTDVAKLARISKQRVWRIVNDAKQSQKK